MCISYPCLKEEHFFFPRSVSSSKVLSVAPLFAAVRGNIIIDLHVVRVCDSGVHLSQEAMKYFLTEDRSYEYAKHFSSIKKIASTF